MPIFKKIIETKYILNRCWQLFGNQLERFRNLY